jgi:hypothetical protein
MGFSMTSSSQREFIRPHDVHVRDFGAPVPPHLSEKSIPLPSRFFRSHLRYNPLVLLGFCIVAVVEYCWPLRRGVREMVNRMGGDRINLS